MDRHGILVNHAVLSLGTLTELLKSQLVTKGTPWGDSNVSWTVARAGVPSTWQCIGS